MSREIILQLEDITFAYPDQPRFFSGLDLTVHRGDLIGLVGANGSGKTTLFHLIMGLRRPARGTLKAFRNPVVTPEDVHRLRARVGFLFQDSDDQLFCPTVMEDVAFGPLNLGKTPEQTREIVRKVLRQVEMEDFAHRITALLSGGEKRRVALATALAMEPEILILDEPNTGLDPRSKLDMAILLAKIGGTQIIASHDLEFIRTCCRRVVLLSGGSMIADGETDAVLSNQPLMLAHGLEVPYSLEAHPDASGHGHHHGSGPGHGHGHAAQHGEGHHG